MKYLILILALVLSGCAGQNEFIDVTPDPDLQMIKEYAINKEPSLAQLQGYDLAVALRAHMFRTVNLRSTHPNYWIVSKFENFKRLHEEPSQWGHVCGGIGLSLYDLFLAFGFEARVIQLYGRNYPAVNGDTHVANEVRINGKWVVMDATFNMTLKDQSGNSLSYDEAFQKQKNGEFFQADTDGSGNLDRLNAYYLPMSDFLVKPYTVSKTNSP